ncbi:MAG: AbrB/MazE/SpoVT family DNA-binding domain-containing protein [Acidiferrobacteraceae bacterium]
MKSNIVRIGNSKGIRLPKSVLEQCRLKDAVEIEVEGGVLMIRPADVPRNGWSEAFSGMVRHKDDKLLDEDTGLATGWDRSEWRW